MSRERGRDARKRFYDRGNSRCPICLTSFTKDAVEAGMEVTLEHVPPKALGGSVKCLTCTDCNQSASKSLDQAVAMRVRADAARKAGRGEKVELDVCGAKHTTYLSPDGISRKDLDSRLVSEPLVKSFLQQLGDRKLIFLAQLQRGPDWDVTKGITITARRPSANHMAVSWLRSSYLLVFSLLGQSGYRYAESEAIRPIRDQIMRPDEELVPSLLCDVSQLRVPDELILINNWQQPFAG